MFLRKFAFRKLGADRGQIYVCKTDSSCPPRPAKGLSPLESQAGQRRGGVFDVFMRVCGANAGEVCNCTPSGTVPLHRTGQYLCTERGSTPAPNEVCTCTLNEVYHRTLSEVCTHTRTRRIYYPFPASSPPCKDSCI